MVIYLDQRSLVAAYLGWKRMEAAYLCRRVEAAYLYRKVEAAFLAWRRMEAAEEDGGTTFWLDVEVFSISG
jgi:hypothetical protein